MTYAELEEASTRLAALLWDSGVRSGDRVGIYLPKCIDAVVGIFGTLKADAVYVPIDPSSPPLRVAHILNDCGIRHLISSSRQHSHLLAAESGIRAPELDTLVLMDREPRVDGPPDHVGRVITLSEIDCVSAEPCDSRRIETDLAYILYTSGSTGVPKGVMVSHRAALTFIDWTYDHFSISERDIVSSHAPFHFDLSIFDIFTTIKAGGTIALVPPHLSAFPAALARWIQDQRITVWYSVPSALTLMLTRGNFSAYDYSALRLILFAGEVFPIKYLRELKAHTRARLFNLYGPTETNVCTYYEVKDISPDRIAPVPIGKAIANYEVFALSEDGRPIERHEKGELFARGPGLMSGYWGDPAKTDRVLVPNPLAGPYAERACRTGDIVTLDDEGNYVYVGRRDHMIKSRGYRIELGEIETILYGHPAVSEAAVIALPDEEVTNRIKAFIVPERSDALTGDELQLYCAERLPRYMVPEIIEFLESLPKTSTGKVDRQSLCSQSVLLG